jgi:hypothetical protein
MKAIKIVEQVRKGVLLTELDREYERALAHTRDTGQKTKLTLTLEIVPQGEGQVYIDGVAKATLPNKKTRPTLFFITAEGELTRQDPSQQEIPGIADVRIVAGGKA